MYLGLKIHNTSMLRERRACGWGEHQGTTLESSPVTFLSCSSFFRRNWRNSGDDTNSPI